MDLSNMSSKFVILLCLVVGIGARLARSSVVQTALICDGDYQLIDGMGGKLRVFSAFYGSNDPSVCPPTNSTSTPCKNGTVGTLIHNMCDGRCQCLLAARNDLFGDPCPNVAEYITLTYIIV